jgi:hypothetical protein
MILDNVNLRDVLPFGWTISRAQPVYGGIVTVFASDGVAPNLPRPLVSLKIPSGMRYLVTGYVMKEVNFSEFSQAGGFMMFNGVPCVEGFSSRRADGVEVPVYRDFGMGLLELAGINMSNQFVSGEAIDAEIRGSIYGVMLRPTKRLR